MSTLIVENLKGPTTGSNANKIIVPSGQTLDASEGFTPPAGHVVNVTRWTTSSFNGSSSSNTYTTIASTSLTANAGNIMHVSGVFPTRGDASSGWNLTILRLTSSVDGDLWGSSYLGQSGTTETILSGPINTSWIWGGTGENAHTISLLVRAYDGNLRKFGTTSQESYTTTPVLTFTEIAQ